jgi:hypothetical protein
MGEEFLEYARACREMVARMPDAQDKQKLLEPLEVSGVAVTTRKNATCGRWFRLVLLRVAKSGCPPTSVRGLGEQVLPMPPLASASDGEKPNMSADEPRNPLALLRVPPTQEQVVEHMCEEIEHAISLAQCTSSHSRFFGSVTKRASTSARKRKPPGHVEGFGRGLQGKWGKRLRTCTIHGAIRSSDQPPPFVKASVAATFSSDRHWTGLKEDTKCEKHHSLSSPVLQFSPPRRRMDNR